ncbi:MAG TPA: LamG domain-containing protein [Polyangiales bacterium]|nr:LamG domain-containing protein [Polyangiales bacterium]
MCVWLAGCNVYNPQLVGSSRAADPTLEPIEDAAAPSGCDADCEPEQADASAPAMDAAPAADSGKPAAATPPPGDVESVRDECPKDPAKLLPGKCGCGQPDIDSDGDGTLDCEDGCPEDPLKTAARICGCGTSDADSDSDGSADCVDACPRDARKTSVGACGCGVADSDQDGDGTVDCVDLCPRDRAKTAPGICGCGNVDPKLQEHPDAWCAKRWLLHRYSFAAGDTFASDRVGTAHAMIVAGDAVATPGALTFSGDLAAGAGTETYVDLPQTAWPRGDSATFEAWITWKGAPAMSPATWQRVFDFGDQRMGMGNSFVALTPDGGGGVRATFSTGGSQREVYVITNGPLAQNVVKHLAVVVDGQRSTLSLYIDGRAQGSVKLPDKLSNVVAVNRWLGRSNYDIDPAYYGSLHEFRIYGAALTEAQLAATYAAGPDYTFPP